jgi:hypothetical protein
MSELAAATAAEVLAVRCCDAPTPRRKRQGAMAVVVDVRCIGDASGATGGIADG